VAIESDDDMRWSEEWEVTGARNSWHLPWQPSPAMIRRPKWVTAMWWMCPITWRKAVNQMSPESSSEAAVATRYGGRSKLLVGRYLRRRYLLNPERYPVDPIANHGGEGTNLRTAHRRRGSLNLFPPVHCTMAQLFQLTWQPDLQSLNLHFSCNDLIIFL
jgi:hypothetical protein